MTTIHPAAIVDPKARLGSDVSIGPFCMVGPDVELGDGVELLSHVVITGHTRLGARSRVYPFASLGNPPQSLRHKGEPTTLEIGENSIIREYVTMNPGTVDGGGVTVVGANGFFMVGVHIAHDCHVGKNIVMANCATLGGHVTVGDYVNIGGLTAVHQFCRIGSYAMLGGASGVVHDVIPFGSTFGVPARMIGLNLIGLKRRGFSRDDINMLRAAYRLLFAQEGTMAERLDDVSRLYSQSKPVMDVVNFITADSSRAICQPDNSRA